MAALELMITYADLISLWNYPIPAKVDALLKVEPTSYVFFDGKKIDVPWPPLSLKEIASAHGVADDWDIPKGFVPVMGDFHDLVCLSFNEPMCSEVVIINDERTELARYASIEEFMSNIQTDEDEPLDLNSKNDLVDEWLDF